MKRNTWRGRHSGLTVLECLFAMGIMLIGLVGVASMVPFAGRQASDSYRSVQSLATGKNTIEFANSNQVFRPSLAAPWQVVNDENNSIPDSRNSFFDSVETLYGTLYAESRPTTVTIQQEYEAANAVLGVGFCMDPNFWGNQARYTNKLTERSWGHFRRTRFPFYHESYPTNFDPFDTGSTQTTPRLLRVSLRDPEGTDRNGNNGWLKVGASRALTNMNGGDITKLVPESDNSGGPLRRFSTSLTTGQVISSLQGASVSSTGTWLATIVPSDESPILEPSSLPTTTLPFVPESYDLSIVVFGKRDARELAFANEAAYLAFDSARVPAVSEKLAAVSFPTPLEAMTSSTFDVDLSIDEAVGLKSKIGDWIMLSRDKILMDAQNGWIGRRQKHGWYRVISISEEISGPSPYGNRIVTNRVRLTGKPWGWTLSELDSFRERKVYDATFDSPNFPTTVSTLVPHVVNVYQRSLSISRK